MRGDEWTFGWGALEAIATIIAAGAAIVAGFFAAQAWRKERQTEGHLRRQRDADRESARRAQADLVAAWIIRERAASLGLGDRIAIRNASDVPIYDVHFQVLGQHLPDEDLWDIARGRAARVIPPGDEPFSVPVAHHLVAGGELGTAMDMLVDLVFRDAAGNIWRRRFDGRLESLREEPDDAERRSRR